MIVSCFLADGEENEDAHQDTQLIVCACTEGLSKFQNLERKLQKIVQK